MKCPPNSPEFKIICSDKPINWNDPDAEAKSNPSIREKHLAHMLYQTSKKGKTVVWIGAAHAAKDTTPYKSARSLLERKGVQTSGIKIESNAAQQAHARYDGETLATFYFLGLHYYFKGVNGSESMFPTEPVLYPTEKIPEMVKILDPTPPLNHRFATLPYKGTYDYVLFLP